MAIKPIKLGNNIYNLNTETGVVSTQDSKPVTLFTVNPSTGAVSYNSNVNLSNYFGAGSGTGIGAATKDVKKSLGVSTSQTQPAPSTPQPGQPPTQSPGSADPGANSNQTNQETGNGLEPFPEGTFGEKEKFGSLMYPKTMNRDQDRIFITQFQYKRTGVLMGETQYSGMLGELNEGGSKKNVVGTVTLPMPNDISESNSVGWGEDSLSNIAAMLMPGAVGAVNKVADGNIIGALSTGLDTTKEVLTDPGFGERIKQLLPVKAAAGIVGKFGVNVNPEAFIVRSTGAAINPNLELLFNGPKLRQFVFQFKMTPRSAPEADQIRRIIRFFKQGMAPRRSADNDASFFLGTPNIFKIQFKSRGKELKSIGKIKTCALVSFNVNYTPDGFYAAYQDAAANGSQPIAVSIQLGFTELTPVFNDEYDNNYNDIGPNKLGADKEAPELKGNTNEPEVEPNQGSPRSGSNPSGQTGGIDPTSTNQLRGRAR